MRRQKTVAEYPPEMLQAWRLNAQGHLHLGFETKGKATNFRQRLHAFRKAWIIENGQASQQDWWNFDLEIVNIADGTSAGAWVLRSYANSIKTQINQLAAASIAESEAKTDIKVIESQLKDEPLESALGSLGFGSK